MGNPTVTPIAENWHAGGFVVWDPSDGMLTREAITLKSGAGVCTAGLVLAPLYGTATVTPAAAVSGSGGTVGNGSIGTVTADAGAQEGDYRVVITNPATNLGNFEVIRPDGEVDGVGTVGTAYNGMINFTLADGSNDWVEDDYIVVNVAYDPTAVKYGPYDPTATDGHQNAAAILWSGYRDATSADKKAVAYVRGPCKVQAAELVWGANVTTAQQKTDAETALAALGILSV